MKTIVVVLAILLCGCASQRREEYFKAHPALSAEMRQVILNGRVRLGMSRDEVVASWGKPHDVNTSVGAWGVHEQWVYGGCSRFGCNQQYLYFENSKLTSWED